MAGYEDLFLRIFIKLPKNDFLSNPGSIINFMRDAGFEKSVIRMIETIIELDRKHFITSLTCNGDYFDNNVQTIANHSMYDVTKMREVLLAIRHSVSKCDPSNKTITSSSSNNENRLDKQSLKIVNHPKYGKCYSTKYDTALFSEDLTTLLHVSYKLPSFTIPDTIVRIAPHAFHDFHNSFLQSIVIPESVVEIGQGAFACCTSLKSVNILGPISSIGDGAFSNCYSLEEITLPCSLRKLGKSVFYNCFKLKIATINGSIMNIGDSTFKSCNSLEKVTIPDTITHIGKNAFEYCISLSSIRIPESTISIADGAFEGCKSLREVYIPNSVEYIGHFAFGSCDSLERTSIPSNVEMGYVFPETTCIERRR